MNPFYPSTTNDGIKMGNEINEKSGDAAKYNLRCIRSISEKMTKKDFIYDIRRPIQGATRKFDGQKRQIVLPIQLRRKHGSDSKMPQYTLTERRVLGFECNFCREPIATLLSLSTHVKFHCQRYCKMCYWILQEDETMDRHLENTHRIKPDPSMANYQNLSDLNETLLAPRSATLGEDYIFDRTDVKVIFVTLYSIVFFCCVVGNLMVILVVTLSRRLRSITNFFLANLAVADLCVGIFCVYQTLTNYLTNSWQLGDFLCKVYMFVHALSYTASIMILVVVCSERYLAIIHPIKCRAMLTRGKLRVVIGVVWLLAAIYASPRFVYVETIRNHLNTGGVDIICVANLKKHNKNVLDAVNLFFLYLLPLSLMCCLYTRIGIGLWRSGAALGGPGLVARTRNGRVHHVHTSSRNVLRARRGVVRMLIAVVVTFAICNLPQQARIVWLHWDPNYDRTSDFSTILTVSTFLISYTNSCLNPLLYAFLSRNFRKGVRELLVCNPRGQGGRMGMNCVDGGDAGRHENGQQTIVPHSSIVRLSSAQDNPCLTQSTTTAATTTTTTTTTTTISKQNSLMRNS